MRTETNQNDNAPIFPEHYWQEMGYLTPRQAFELYNLTPESLQMRVLRGTLLKTKQGSSVLYKISDILDIVAERESRRQRSAQHKNNKRRKTNE